MFFVKRAWFYVKRKWGKVFTVGFILFIVASLVLTGLLIKSASISTFEIARNKLGASVTYTADLSSVMEGMRGEFGRQPERGGGINFTLPADYTSITTKEIELIAQNSKYVKNYVVSATLAAKAVDFSYYNPSNSDSEFGFPMVRNDANINIVGVDTKSKEADFNSTITSGRYFTDEEIDKAANVILIEKTIADLNDISVGDTITVSKFNRQIPMRRDINNEEGIEITYEVIGIYKTNNPTDLTVSRFMGSFNLSENTMYAPYTTVLSSELVGLEGEELEEAKTNIEENGYNVQNVIFNLKNPNDIEAFIDEVKNMDGINTTYRSLSANDEAYNKMVGPIENVANTSTVLVIVVVIAGAFIIGLISMLTIKDRKYELGVLLSLGESRIKIISQLITEMLIVAIISFGLATIVSNFTAQGTTNYLLNQAIEDTEENLERPNNRFGQPFGGGFMNRPNETRLSNIDVETIDTLTVNVNAEDVLKMFGIGILIIVIGNVMQASFVLRYNPKEILLER